MNEKRKRSDESNLNLSVKAPIEYESVNRIPTLKEAMDFELKRGHVDPNADLKKMRRIMSNRLSAQRTRNKRTEYIAELEKKANDLQDTVTLLRQTVENVKDNKKKLLVENEILQHHLHSITYDSNLRNAQTEELKAEIKRLKELAMAQNGEENEEIEGENSNSNDLESAEGIDQYLNFDAIDFSPPKNEDIDQYLNFDAIDFSPPENDDDI